MVTMIDRHVQCSIVDASMMLVTIMTIIFCALQGTTIQPPTSSLLLGGVDYLYHNMCTLLLMVHVIADLCSATHQKTIIML